MLEGKAFLIVFFLAANNKLVGYPEVIPAVPIPKAFCQELISSKAAEKDLLDYGRRTWASANYLTPIVTVGQYCQDAGIKPVQ